MKHPVGAVETSHATIWAANGIVFSVSNGVRANQATMEENFAVFRDITRGTRAPLLLDARKWWGGSPEAWDTAIRNMADTFNAVAMLIPTDTSINVGSFPETISRLVIPFRVFTDEAEAMSFLQGFLPKADPSFLTPPADATSTPGATIWMADGVLFVSPNRDFSSAESMGAAFDAYKNLTGGVPAPLLVDARRWKGGDTGAWTTIATEVSKVLTACALFVDSDGTPLTPGPFFLDRMPIPVRVFADADEAMRFVQEHRANQ